MIILIGTGLVSANAQVNISFNIGSQPAWGPTGYDRADYYYIPDADAYYDVNSRVYVYQYGGRWTRGAYLPGRYRNMDMYNVHKVVINDRDPWLRNDRYRSQYRSYAGRHDQVVIRDSRDQKYWQNPGHPRYNEWKRGHGNDNRGQGNYNRGNDNRGGGNDNRGNNGRGNNGRGNDNHGNNGHGNDNHGGGNGRGNNDNHDKGHGRGR